MTCGNMGLLLLGNKTGLAISYAENCCISGDGSLSFVPEVLNLCQFCTFLL